MTEHEQLPPRALAVLEWLKTEEGRRSVARAVEASRVITARLEKLRQPNPKSLREPFTL